MRSFLYSSFYLPTFASLFFLASCASLGPGKTKDGTWTVSWYGDKFHGRQTSSGEMYDMHEFTAAHRALAFGTRLELYYPATGRKTAVRVNDRGPFIHGRDLDLSRAAAQELGIMGVGVAQVRVRVLGAPGLRPVAQIHGESGTDSVQVPPLPPVATATPPRNEGWVIQIGSFRESSRAQAWAQTVPADCGAAFIEGLGPHRVFVGPFVQHDAALEAESRLRGRGFSTLVKAVR